MDKDGKALVDILVMILDTDNMDPQVIYNKDMHQ
jgi:hypothetical protein